MAAMVRGVEINARCFQWDDRPLPLGEDVLRQGSRILARWAASLPVEPTWIQRQWHVPAGLVRLDCVVSNGAGGEGPPVLECYEVEDRPTKIGLLSLCDPAFRSRLTRCTNEWSDAARDNGPLCVVFLNDTEQKAADDEAWAEICDLHTALRERRLLLTRGFPSEEDYDDIASASVVVLRHHADKTYGERLGWYRRVTVTDLAPGSQLWATPFGLKPCTGEVGRDVMLWAPAAQRSGVEGANSEEEIRQVLERNGTMYIQPFIPPMRCPHHADWLMVYRIYYAYSPRFQEYVPLGGLWDARKNHLKIVGGDDEIHGPLKNSRNSSTTEAKG